jgi:tripartite-type tricarboxylate transporter receptor subunit TctC
MPDTRLARCVHAAAWLVAASANALAQDYPARPVQVISSASVGSGGDIALRMLAARAGAGLGQPVVVEARPGAQGALAAGAVARAEPDGYTVLFATQGTLVTSRFLVKGLPFDSLKDFTPIIHGFSIPSFLVVHSSVPANTVKELMDFARRHPGKLAYGSTGFGSPFHLLGESFKLVAGVDMLHVPYAAGRSALPWNDLLNGRMQVYFPSYTTTKPFLNSDKIRVLAVIDEQRSRTLPDLPTVNESMPEFFNIVAWYAFFGPGGLQPPVVERLNAELGQALKFSDIVAKLTDLGISITGGTPEDLAGTLKRDIENIGRLAGKLGIRPE